MRWQTTNRWVQNFSETDVPEVLVTGLYEDLEAGLRSKALIECVRVGMHLPVRFKFDFWRFDWLREQSLRAMALSAAKSSALVIVSISRAKGLPVQMQKWVTAWAEDEEAGPSAMVALLPDGHDVHSRWHPLRQQLESAAKRRGADFFHEFFEPKTKKRRPAKKAIHREDEQTTAEFVAQFGQPPGRFPILPRQSPDGFDKWRQLISSARRIPRTAPIFP